jgi:hypothetical protein
MLSQFTLKNLSSKTLFQQDFITSNFKMLGKLTHIDRTDFSDLALKPKVEVCKQSDVKLLPIFKTFVISNLSSNSKIFVPHASFRSFYINYSKGGASIINIKKFFQK